LNALRLHAFALRFFQHWIPTDFSDEALKLVHPKTRKTFEVTASILPSNRLFIHELRNHFSRAEMRVVNIDILHATPSEMEDYVSWYFQPIEPEKKRKFA